MINSSRKHYENNLVVQQHLKAMMILGFIGAVIGAVIAQFIEVNILKVIFGLICILSTLVLVIIKSPSTLDNIRTEKYLFYSASFLTALLNGLIGPAGAAILIPIFVAYFKYPLKNTLGTTSALAVTTSLGGVLCYIILGWNNPNLPAFSLGYVNLLQFVFLTITSIIVSTYAASLAKKISVKKLKILQVIVISYRGLQMMGLFDLILSIV